MFAYMNRTLAIRVSQTVKGLPKPTQLFLSWVTKRPVTKSTMARWLTSVLKLSGIDTNQFTVHSYRGAGLSAALTRGAPIDQPIKVGNWTNTNTFMKHCNALLTILQCENSFLVIIIGWELICLISCTYQSAHLISIIIICLSVFYNIYVCTFYNTSWDNTLFYFSILPLDC